MESTDKMQFERISNLIAGFGWKSIREEITDDTQIMVIERRRDVSQVKSSPGPG